MLDYTKLASDEHYRVDIAPTGDATGVDVIAAPTADELNNAAGSGFTPASQSISWNDMDFGTAASETLNEPSLADASTYEEFGQNNFGGGMSFWMPRNYDDDSNLHSLIYDLTDQPGALLDIATRLDGNLETTDAWADGQFVSVYEVRGDSESNPFTPGESKRRTVGFNRAGTFSHNTVVGDHAITAVEPASFAEGSKGRIRALQGGRDTTNRLEFTSDDSAVISVYPGGFYEVTGATTETATVTITDPDTGDTDTVAVAIP